MPRHIGIFRSPLQSRERQTARCRQRQPVRRRLPCIPAEEVRHQAANLLRDRAWTPALALRRHRLPVPAHVLGHIMCARRLHARGVIVAEHTGPGREAIRIMLAALAFGCVGVNGMALARVSFASAWGCGDALARAVEKVVLEFGLLFTSAWKCQRYNSDSFYLNVLSHSDTYIANYSWALWWKYPRNVAWRAPDRGAGIFRSSLSNIVCWSWMVVFTFAFLATKLRKNSLLLEFFDGTLEIKCVIKHIPIVVVAWHSLDDNGFAYTYF